MVTSSNQIYLVTHTNIINLKKNYLVTSFKVILFNFSLFVSVCPNKINLGLCQVRISHKTKEEGESLKKKLIRIR